jgi:hypothetical protein
MIGSTKLGTIRGQLRDAVAAAADDPFQWLEQRMAATEHGISPSSDRTEVLESLRRVLEGTGREKGRKRRAGTKR